MTAKYFAILTSQGAAKLANATMLGTKLNLTQLAVGDANGTLPTPDPAQTKLINQKRIAPLNLLTVDPDNTSQIIAEQIIPENEGGFWIREIGLYDDDGILIAVANCPETYKPQLQEGSGRTQTIRMILIVSSTSAITLKIDPSVVLATRKYVDDKVIEVKAYSDDLMKKHVHADNPHTQYPLIANALKEMADAGLVAEVLKNLGLGEAAKLNVGTTAGTVAAGNDSRFNQQIGVAQAWQDVTAQRQLGVTYTNTTGRPIQVLLDFVRPAAPAPWNFGVKIDSVAYPNGGGSYCPIIPPGSTYAVLSQGITQYTWRELR